jgi:hypothetical protein
MSLQLEQIAENWKTYRERVDMWFPERADVLNTMYDALEDRMMIMPASSIDHYHNAFDGGYVDHVLRVMDCASTLYSTWGELGASLDGFTKEELMFAAMHHDLGKVGFPHTGGEIYVPNESEWHRKNQGKIYTHNSNNPFTMVPDLGLWILQKFNVSVTWNEYQGIRIHDGLYDEANKPYFISRNAESKLRTNLPMILHHADLLAARIEYEMWRDKSVIKSTTKKKPSTPKPAIDSSKLFEDLFGA